jgi:glycosyltransferase involved in cell wall biosynthesis
MLKKRLLIFIVAYHAEKTIQSVLSRIPHSLMQSYDVEVLIIDDASNDATFKIGADSKAALTLPFNVTVLQNPVNQGYGGNQKIGYHYAIKFCFDYVALVHGDGQYAPECLPGLLAAFNDAQIKAVFGSRMLTRGQALKGGMPLYKYVGNKILTTFENKILHSNLSEFHSGYRLYAVDALKQVPFECNTNDFHFDTEIIIQFIAKGFEIKELPIPTYYGDEICRVNGIKYALDVVLAVLKFRAQGLGIFYDRRFDLVTLDNSLMQYEFKVNDVSPHSITLGLVNQRSAVLDLGCASGYIGEYLKSNKQCHVTGVDRYPHPNHQNLNAFIEHDLFLGPPQFAYENLDYILLLDVIEHVPNPEKFLESLHVCIEKNPKIQLLISTGNVAFIITRLMLLFGQFNYGKRGILDMTHTRLFTFSSLRRILEQSGYEVRGERGVPAPFGLALQGGVIAKLFTKVNNALIYLARNIFSYQIYVIATPRPSVNSLLDSAVKHSQDKLYH